ncbi:MAG TPA: hypothetical protein VJT69_09975 [Pyrinomonadaceae bacterium]|nr:hypothetical protein [Pyrinomonadaceae bacterium]
MSMSVIASADTKIKSRQTSGGQTYENTSYIKGKRQRSETSGGQMIVIQQCDLRRNIQIMPAAKMYMIQPYDEPAAGTAPSSSSTTTQPSAVKKGGVVTSIVTTKDTGERKQMFGYTARHIITTMEMKSSPDACSTVDTRMQIDGWYIDAAFALDCDSNRAYTAYKPKAGGGCQDRYETKQIGTARKGYPVWEKTTMFGPNGAESFSSTNEVVEFSQATLDQSLFELPEGYRQVEDFSSAFSAAAMSAPDSSNTSTSPSVATTTPTTQPNTTANQLGPKRAGVIRLGVTAVKTSNVTEGMNAAELATAVKNTLLQNLKSGNVEVVPIDATGAAIQTEAQQKECDYVVYTNVSIKKGGGGFGSVFGSTAAKIGAGIVYPSSTAAVVAVNTATVAQNIKAKDELSMDIRLERPGSTTPSFAQQYKGKAKSAGEDIITPLVQQASTAIVSSVSKQ